MTMINPLLHPIIAQWKTLPLNKGKLPDMRVLDNLISLAKAARDYDEYPNEFGKPLLNKLITTALPNVNYRDRRLYLWHLVSFANQNNKSYDGCYDLSDLLETIYRVKAIKRRDAKMQKAVRNFRYYQSHKIIHRIHYQASKEIIQIANR